MDDREQGVDVPGGQHAAQLDAVPQRSRPGHGSSQSGSWETGKNVPANRNIGIRHEPVQRREPPVVAAFEARRERGDRRVEREPAEHAANGASTANGEVTAPPIAATAVKITAAEKTRIAAQPIVPSTSSATRTGVASTAWYVRSHLIPGHHRPHRVVRAHLHRRRSQKSGRDELDVRQPSERRLVVVDQLPSRTPTESRKKIGLRNAVVIVARHVRLYERACHSVTESARSNASW